MVVGVAEVAQVLQLRLLQAGGDRDDRGPFGQAGLLRGPSGIGDVVSSGAAIVITSDDPDATVDAWQNVLDAIEDSAGDTTGIDVERDGNRVVISAGDYLDSVLTPDERLGDLDAFRRAVPQSEGANSVVYLDLKDMINLVDDVSGSGSLDFADGIQALGLTTAIESDDSYSFALRLTTEAK